MIGPHLAATMSYLSGRHHIGRRAVEEIVETVFDVPTSLGSISALEAEGRAPPWVARIRRRKRRSARPQ